MVSKIKIILIVLFLLGMIFLGSSQQAALMIEHPGYLLFMRVL